MFKETIENGAPLYALRALLRPKNILQSLGALQHVALGKNLQMSEGLIKRWAIRPKEWGKWGTKWGSKIYLFLLYKTSI